MAISVPQIEAEFNRLNRGLNLDKITSDAQKLIQQRLVGATSQLGKTVGESVGGFQALTAAVDDIIPSLDASVPTQLVDRLAVAQMTANVPGVSARIIKSMDTVASNAVSDMAAITGAVASEIDNGFIDQVVSSANPEAVAAALSQIPNDIEIPLDEISQATKNLVNTAIPLTETFTASTQKLFDGLTNQISDQFPHVEDFAGKLTNSVAQLGKTVGELESSLDDIVKNSATQVKSITRKAEEAFGNINTQISSVLANSNLGFGTIGQNLVDKVGGVVVQAVNSIAQIDGVVSTVPIEQLKKVRTLIDAGNFAQAATLLQPFSESPLNEIEDVLRGIDVTMAGNLGVTGNSGQSSSVPTTRIGANAALWNGAETSDEAFSLIITHEELEVELKSAQREITEIIVHWTETNINQDIGSEEIHAFAAENGDGIPYHYLIRRDGSLQRGRPIDEIGGSLANGHENYSIQIAFVGGINAPADVTEIVRFLSSESLTSAQMNTFKLFLQKAYSAWPGIQALGHSEIDRAQADPGFNVSIYTKNVFQKQSVYNDLYNQAPYTRSELIRTPIPT